jgi:hypothetical protein
MKRTGRVMQIIATLIWAYKLIDDYPFNYNKNWILLVFGWGLCIMVVEFFIEFAEAMKE